MLHPLLPPSFMRGVARSAGGSILNFLRFLPPAFTRGVARSAGGSILNPFFHFFIYHGTYTVKFLIYI